MPKLYLNKTVDVALRERMAWIFDRFETVIVSISGGKDSTVLFHAAQQEARARGRKLHCFFLDQEAEYQATIDHVRVLMHSGPEVVPLWFQVPIRMTNTTSYFQEFLRAWWPGEQWIRDKEQSSIREQSGAPDRFYDFFEWYEQQWDPDTACFLVGLRAEESLNRYRSVTKHPAIDGVPWSSRGKGAPRLYPLYDFTFESIWTYIGRNRLPYNRAYDWLYATGAGIKEMRVSYLAHEHSFQCLAKLQEFEPDTWERLQARLQGVHAAGIYAKESTVYSTGKRPKAYPTWKAYRDFLLDSFPGERVNVFRQRFSGQPGNETVYRQQCRQLLLNDYENSVPVLVKEEPKDELEKWKNLL